MILGIIPGSLNTVSIIKISVNINNIISIIIIFYYGLVLINYSIESPFNKINDNVNINLE